MAFIGYVHDLNPVLFPLFGGVLQIRWYGLAYLAGFVAGYFLLRYLARKKLWILPEEKVGDFIALAAFWGVFLGGRLGYILFYVIPDRGIGEILKDPFMVFRVWDGGMASHGGFLGLILFCWWFSRKHHVSFLGVGDGLCTVAPLGLFFGRLANFINGELYGRVFLAGKWAVKFPAALFDPRSQEYGLSREALQTAQEIDPETTMLTLVERMRGNEELEKAVEPFLSPRHPSQLYEALLEGAVIFAILWVIRLKWRRAPHGIFAGLFFIIYAIFRIGVERFRMPDARWVVEGLLTKGQFYSLFMLVIGSCFLLWPLLRKKNSTH